MRIIGDRTSRDYLRPLPGARDGYWFPASMAAGESGRIIPGRDPWGVDEVGAALADLCQRWDPMPYIPFDYPVYCLPIQMAHWDGSAFGGEVAGVRFDGAIALSAKPDPVTVQASKHASYHSFLRDFLAHEIAHELDRCATEAQLDAFFSLMGTTRAQFPQERAPGQASYWPYRWREQFAEVLSYGLWGEPIRPDVHWVIESVGGRIPPVHAIQTWAGGLRRLSGTPAHGGDGRANTPI